MSKITYATKVTAITNTLPEINKVTSANMNEIKASVNDLYDIVPANVTGYVVVDSVDDLPDEILGVRTLLADTAYFFVTTIDLLGGRLVGADNTTLLGTSSETSVITSTGLGVGVPLFSSIYTTPIREISFSDVDTALSIQGAANEVALDWNGVNFVNVPNIGVLNGGGNWIFTKGSFLNSKGLIISGSWGTIGADNSLFRGDGLAGSIISLSSSAVITRRFRITYSSIIATSLTVGITVDALATIPLESFILDSVAFSGGGTYLSGITNTSLTAIFNNCVNITSTYELANYYMSNNAVATDIVTQGVPVKVSGTTTLNTLSQKFTHSNNRATYVAGFTRLFNISSVVTITSLSSNDQIGIYIAKNGVVIDSSETYVTTNASNRAENAYVQTVVELSTNDYIEIWVENNTDNSDLTVVNMNTLVKAIR